MAIEQSLPENVQRRVERQRADTEADVAALRTALEFAEKVLPAVRGPNALRTFAMDPVTVHQAQLLVKCLQADLGYAVQLQAAAWRIYCEEMNIDPDDRGEHEDPNDYIGMGWLGSDGRP